MDSLSCNVGPLYPAYTIRCARKDFRSYIVTSPEKIISKLIMARAAKDLQGVRHQIRDRVK